MKRNYLLVLVLCISSFRVWAQSGTLDATLLEMADRYYMPTVRAALGTFTFETSGLPTPFARWLEDRLVLAASASKRMELLNRNAAAAMDPAFRKQYEEFFAGAGTGALLHGAYFVEGQDVRVRLELTDLGSATLIDARDWTVRIASLPAYATVRPTIDAAARARELSSLAASPAGGLVVSVSTERGAGAAYREGEELGIMLSVNKDAYVRLYHVDGAGRIQLIWPNRYGGGKGLMKAGSLVRIPSDGDPFAFKLQPPYGTEFLKAVASTVPFVDSQEDFSDLGGEARDVMTRGLSVVSTASTETLYAEALASYYIGPRE